jgi:hypothetical protein
LTADAIAVKVIVMSATAQALLADLPDTEVIPLPLIRDRIGWDRQAQHNAVSQGLIQPLPQRGKAGCFQVTRDEAVIILIAAALAFAAGVAVVVMLRAIRGTGLNAQTLAESMT